MDWKRIAEALTEKWYDNGMLPFWKDDIEYNYIHYVPRVKFSHLTNTSTTVGCELRFARSEIFFEESNSFSPARAFIRCHGSIDKDLALREAWSHLTESEKTAIMSETLGMKNDKSE